MEIGERIRQIRIHKGFTQTELVKGICSTTYISKIESGKTKPSYSFLVKVARALEVDFEFLMNTNVKNIEYDIHRIYELFMETKQITSQNLALLKLHARENHPNSTLIKIYSVLISYYLNHEIEETHQLVEQSKNIISSNYSSSENEISYYFDILSKYYYFTNKYTEAFLYANLHLNSLQGDEPPLRIGKAYYNISLIRTKIDEDLELARLYNKKALNLFQTEHYNIGIGNALSQLAIQYHRNELYEEALDILQQLDTFSKKHNLNYYEPIIQFNYGRIHQLQKQYDQAIMYFTESIEMDTNSGNEELTIHALKCLSEVYIELKNWEEANQYLEKAFRLTHAYNVPNEYIQLNYLKCQIYKIRFDFPSYEKGLQQAIQLAQDGKYPLLVKQISTELANHYNSLRAYKMAAKYYRIALNISEDFKKTTY
ncbi:helix-turn-helix domain-containing protein [Rummeliibacillus sp. NPDC094406]|uniref:helix-turn-helix domain-containing protein n=1 Tax=Rummeliibacillus sp. NPDC094406 TaxID=3364511 RepID=UPI0038027F63